MDAFACRGGAGVGYQRAGFCVSPVETNTVHLAAYPVDCEGAQRFPMDAVEAIRAYGGDFAVRHASPPCQRHTTLTKGHLAQGRDYGHVDLIAKTREALLQVGGPYVIENVVGAASELRDPITLCGLAFNLRVFRHRLFESNLTLSAPEHPSHHGHRVAGWRHGVKYEGDMFAVYGEGGGKGTTAEWQAAMGIDWTDDRKALTEAVPPAYTAHIGLQLLTHLARQEAVA